MRSRAEKRHYTEARIERAKVILRRGGWDYGRAAARFDIKAKKFADSRFGCDCGVCANPRRQYRGKNASSLTRQEMQAMEMERE